MCRKFDADVERGRRETANEKTPAGLAMLENSGFPTQSVK
jgi:hypothetical protein